MHLGQKQQQLTSCVLTRCRKLAKQAFLSYNEEDRTVWVLKQPAQLVLAISQVYWCHDVEDRLNSSAPIEGVADFYQARLCHCLAPVNTCTACSHSRKLALAYAGP